MTALKFRDPEGRLRALLSHVGYAGALESDPIVVAAQAAVHVDMSSYPLSQIPDKVIEALGPSATPFERGLAIGFALCLFTMDG